MIPRPAGAVFLLFPQGKLWLHVAAALQESFVKTPCAVPELGQERSLQQRKKPRAFLPADFETGTVLRCLSKVHFKSFSPPVNWGLVVIFD